jgi:ubiquinone/menaquinone biosynthesis C-methylase UbiE
MEYGNWIRRKKLLLLFFISFLFGSAVLLPLLLPIRIFLVAMSAIFLVAFLIPFYSYLMFSQKGGKFQEKIYSLIIKELGDFNGGRILDIGTGNGVLAIKTAEKFPNNFVQGIDCWGDEWEYSKNSCEKNAIAAGVANKVKFEKGDASKLEFPNDSFDAVISNLTFHEVKSAPDKKDIIKEALRVLKPGGKFVFIDYFYESKYYGRPEDLRSYLNGMNLSEFSFKPLKEKMKIPILLLHPKIFGKVGIIYGKK